jgi:alkylation response protein AidB-like acyl-CoA dehydrogenase
MTGAWLVEEMTEAERARAERVESVLPALREAAPRADVDARFPREHVALIRDAGLLGLVVPEEYGGLGGGLRDLAAATFAMGTACPSTALAFFFHCSAASRGLLPVEAIEAGLFSAEEVGPVRAFADKVLRRMGQGGDWFANFASESVKKESAAVTISTTATPVDGGFRLTGVKAFGCGTGVADRYLVTAMLAGSETADGLGLFFVDPSADGVGERAPWDAVGMRGTATHGIELTDVFVPADEALAVPGAFTRMMQVSRGSFVGNQLAATAVYLGAAHAVYRATIDQLTSRTYKDTGRPIGESPMHQEIIGRMSVELETARLWLARQLELETREPPILGKPEVVRQWRLCKGVVSEAAFEVAVLALKAGGTSGTGNRGVTARGLRDLAMGLVQAFPAERGRLEAARMIVARRQQDLFGVGA